MDMVTCDHCPKPAFVTDHKWWWRCEDCELKKIKEERNNKCQ